MTELEKTIGLFFRNQREQSGMSCVDVANVLETVSDSEIEAFEQGHGSIALDDLFALTNLLNVDPDDVLRLLQPAAAAAVEADVARHLQEERQRLSLAPVDGAAAVKISGRGRAQ